jgi:D-tyrosyl-tRNA(Tyr) deacylase
MRLVIQRVKKAQVRKVETSEVVGKIGQGLFILVGIKKGDSLKEAETLAEKVSKLRIIADKEGKMNLSIKDVGGEILVVSQFTLYGNCKGQNRPSFIEAADNDEAEVIYNHFVDSLRRGLPAGRRVETGSFGDYMEIETVLDGPVTILLD